MAPPFDRLIGIIGPARSGTTLLTSVLSAHSDCLAVFEPWNSGLFDIDETARLETLVRRSGQIRASERTLVVKETTTRLEYIGRIFDLMDAMADTMACYPTLIIRNPVHVMLSEYHRRREWWGAGDLELNSKTFDNWCDKTRAAMRKIYQRMANHHGVVISYHSLASDPATTLPLYCQAVGLRFEPTLLEYERHLDRSKVRGDRGIAANPAPIGTESSDIRERQAHEVHRLVRQSPYASWFRNMEALSASADELKVSDQSILSEHLHM